MEEARRVRSLSTSTSCTELELEGVGPEAAPSYLLLLEMAHGCLALVASLSPPLPELLAGTALHDPDRWQLFLHNQVQFPCFSIFPYTPQSDALVVNKPAAQAANANLPDAIPPTAKIHPFSK